MSLYVTTFTFEIDPSGINWLARQDAKRYTEWLTGEQEISINVDLHRPEDEDETTGHITKVVVQVPLPANRIDNKLKSQIFELTRYVETTISVQEQHVPDRHTEDFAENGKRLKLTDYGYEIIE